MIATNVQVADIMSDKVLFASLTQPFTQLCRLFLELDIHHLPILDEKGELVGIISSNDMLRAFSVHLPVMDCINEETLNERLSVADFMTPSPLVTISSKETILKALELFDNFNIRALPVVDDKQVVGIITNRDIVRYSAENDLR